MTTATTPRAETAPRWRLIGPGLVVAATGVGAADLVATMIAGCKFGYALLWAVVIGCLMKVVLVEGAGFPYPHPTVAKPPPGLAEATPPRLHLPMYEYESRRFLVWSADGFPEIVNGRGSFKPASFDALERRMASFPDPAMVRELRELGVRTVVLHPDIVDGTAWEDWENWPLQGTETGEVVLYRLNTGP